MLLLHRATNAEQKRIQNNRSILLLFIVCLKAFSLLYTLYTQTQLYTQDFVQINKRKIFSNLQFVIFRIYYFIFNSLP